MNRVHTSLARHTPASATFACASPPRSPLAATSSCVSVPPAHVPVRALTHAPRGQVNWNEMPLHSLRKAPERAYYLSLGVLTGLALDDALLSLALKLHHAGAT